MLTYSIWLMKAALAVACHNCPFQPSEPESCHTINSHSSYVASNMNLSLCPHVSLKLYLYLKDALAMLTAYFLCPISTRLNWSPFWTHTKHTHAYYSVIIALSTLRFLYHVVILPA